MTRCFTPPPKVIDARRSTGEREAVDELMLAEEVFTMTAEKSKKIPGEVRGTQLEKYLLMDAKEKDAEIEKAIVRLQHRIQTILYSLEAQTRGADGRTKEKKTGSPAF